MTKVDQNRDLQQRMQMDCTAEEINEASNHNTQI